LCSWPVVQSAGQPHLAEAPIMGYRAVTIQVSVGAAAAAYLLDRKPLDGISARVIARFCWPCGCF